MAGDAHAMRRPAPRPLLPWVLSAFLALMLAAAGAEAASLSDAALRFAVRQLERLANGAIEIRNPRGSLLSAIDADEIRYHAGDTQIVAKDVHLEWSPSSLLKRTFHVDVLRARELDVTLGGGGGEKAKLPDSLALPLNLELDRASLGLLHLQSGASEWAIRDIHFGYRGGADGHRFSDIGLKADAGTLAGTLQVGAQAPFAVQGNFTLEGTPALHSPRLQVAASGSLQNLRLQGQGAVAGASVDASASLAPMADVPLQSVDVSGRESRSPCHRGKPAEDRARRRSPWQAGDRCHARGPFRSEECRTGTGRPRARARRAAVERLHAEEGRHRRQQSFRRARRRRHGARQGHPGARRERPGRGRQQLGAAGARGRSRVALQPSRRHQAVGPHRRRAHRQGAEGRGQHHRAGHGARRQGAHREHHGRPAALRPARTRGRALGIGQLRLVGPAALRRRRDGEGFRSLALRRFPGGLAGRDRRRQRSAQARHRGAWHARPQADLALRRRAGLGQDRRRFHPRADRGPQSRPQDRRRDAACRGQPGPVRQPSALRPRRAGHREARRAHARQAARAAGGCAAGQGHAHRRLRRARLRPHGQAPRRCAFRARA